MKGNSNENNNEMEIKSMLGLMATKIEKTTVHR